MAAASISVVRIGPSILRLTPPHLAERAQLIQDSHLAAGLTPAECDAMASCARPRSFARHETLFMQGTPRRELLLVRTGTVKITQIGESGSEVILWMHGRGGVVGDFPEPARNPSNTTARTMESLTALAWDHATLGHLLESYPRIRQNMTSILYGRLVELEERFRELATERVARRLAFTLLRLARVIGKKSQQGIEISLSREELAQMTGTTLFTISRILAQWGKENVILPGRETVLLHDLDRLQLAGADC